MSMRVLPVLLGGLCALASMASAVLLPPEGSSLNRIHVQFEWPAVAGADSYLLEAVVDNFKVNPFGGAPLVVDLFVPGATPRTVVTSGLQFNKAYAWRVRGVQAGVPLGWEPTRRFRTQKLPSYRPGITTSTPVPGAIEPGLTLFNVFSAGAGTIPGGLALAVDSSGAIVWFLAHPAPILDLRLLDNGRMLFCQQQGRGFETTLSGKVAWASPDDLDLQVHHEIFPMPSGNYLMLVYRIQNVLRDGQLQPWAASRIVELDRASNALVWDWNPFDHFSTLDFDPTTMQTPGVGGANLPGAYNWTHQNAVIYDAATDSIYTSSRNLSRITRIDRATGQIVYNMGFDMPSGDTDFGDNLFSFQHSPQILSNGNMLVYDNGNRRDHMDQTSATGMTRAVELAFTGEPPTDAEIVWEWMQPVYAPIVGDADRLPNGNTLVTSGTVGKLHEVDAAGNEVWRLELESGSPNFLIYRAERIAALIVDAPADADGDGVVDEVDNCPDHANPLQRDCDQDGVGDVCSLALGLPDACPCDVVAGDCVCYDFADNDGDGLTDFPDDMGCRAPDDPSEEPDCDDGLDNDNDGTIDWDGVDLNGDGDFLDPGEFPPDVNCQGSPLRQVETARACGLGFELALLLPALLGWAGRRRRGR